MPLTLTVPLTKVKSKGKEHKADIIDKVKELVEEYNHVYVLSFENMTTNPFRQI